MPSRPVRLAADHTRQQAKVKQEKNDENIKFQPPPPLPCLTTKSLVIRTSAADGGGRYSLSQAVWTAVDMLFVFVETKK